MRAEKIRKNRHWNGKKKKNEKVTEKENKKNLQNTVPSRYKRGDVKLKRKKERIYIRVTPEEKKFIQKRMDEMGIKNISGYMLKMAIDGYCVRLDLKDLKELNYLLRMCSNNLNQYAKKANETGSIYQRDIIDLKVRLDKLWMSSREIIGKLSQIWHPCKSKEFNIRL